MTVEQRQGESQSEEQGEARRVLPDIRRKVDLRALEPRDSVSELTELLHRAYKRHADRGMRMIAAYQDESITLKRIAGGECVLAVLREEPRRAVGTIVFKDAGHTRGTPWLDEAGVASFSQLAVEPYLQGRGIGGLLIRHAEERAIQTGAREIALSTPEPARELIAMYTNRGYRVVEYTTWVGVNYRSVIMSKATSEVVAKGNAKQP